MRTKRRRRPVGHGLHQDEDPLSKALAPPPDETEVEREARLAAEGEAQRRSDMIDQELSRQRVVEKKTKCVRVLLLGELCAAYENI
jgi:guanine nucleotide-binding protein subunit alpha